MKSKKIAVIIIAIAFGLVVLTSCFFLFTIKKVEVNYAVSAQKNDTDQVQKTLDEYLNKSLLFLDVNGIGKAVKEQPYLEIVSVEKKYPNILEMNIKERKETYRLKDGEKTYVLSEEGYILNDTGELKHGAKIIDLAFITFRNSPDFSSKITVDSAVVGEKIQTSNDDVVYQTLEIAKKVGLSDCISKIYIEDCTGNEYDVSFETHTGVKIYVYNVVEDGQRKTLTAFNVYDTVASDYQKRFGAIQSLYIGDELIIQHVFDDVEPGDRVDNPLYNEHI